MGVPGPRSREGTALGLGEVRGAPAGGWGAGTFGSHSGPLLFTLKLKVPTAGTGFGGSASTFFP